MKTQNNDFPFFQDKTGERVEGWLAMKTGKLIPSGDREFCKIATPDDIKSYIAQREAEIKEKAIEAIEGIETCCQSQGDKNCGCSIEKSEAKQKVQFLP